MTSMVEAVVPPAQFALEETFATVPDAEVSALRVVAHGRGAGMELLWASSRNRDALVEAMRRDPSTHAVEVVADLEDERLLRVGWRLAVQRTVAVVSQGAATVLDATGRADGWHFQVLFPDRDALSSAYERWRGYGLDASLERVGELSLAGNAGDPLLTDAQYETLEHAHDEGYYDVPRQVTQTDLARAFDVSHQALSERLRRAHGTIVESTLSRTVRHHDGATPTPNPGR